MANRKVVLVSGYWPALTQTERDNVVRRLENGEKPPLGRLRCRFVTGHIREFDHYKALALVCPDCGRGWPDGIMAHERYLLG